MIYRKKILLKQFDLLFNDLLVAIKNNNFEAIENICEDNLTQEIAAKMYEM